RWRILVLLFRKRLRPRECRVAVDVHLCGLVIRAAWGFLPAKEGHTLDQTGREKEGSGSRDVATQDWNDVRPRCPESLSAPADSEQTARSWTGVRRSGRTAADACRARRGGDRAQRQRGTCCPSLAAEPRGPTASRPRPAAAAAALGSL